MIDATDGLTVVGHAANGVEAIDQARRLVPDVVLMDIRMPLLDGISATTRIVAEHDARVRVLVLTTFSTHEYVAQALRAGASGFLLKDAQPDQRVAAIHVEARGDALLDPLVTRTVIESAIRRGGRGRASRTRIRGLTSREAETLELVAHGLSNIRHLFTKPGVHDRVQAVIAAYDAGLVGAPES